MKQEALRYFSDVHLTVIALLLFFCFFVGMAIVVACKSKEEIDQVAQLPLSEGVINE